jgi:hypothetical protein
MKWNYYYEIGEIINKPILSKQEISLLRYHINNLQYLIKSYSFRMSKIRQDLEHLKKQLESAFSIKIDDKVIDHIRELRTKKEDRIEFFISYLRSKYEKIVELEIEDLKDIDRRLKRIEERLLTATGRARASLLSQKQRLLKLKKLSPDDYRKLAMQKFDSMINENMKLISKFVGKVMEMDYVENTTTILEKKLELLQNKLTEIYRKMRIEDI